MSQPSMRALRLDTASLVTPDFCACCGAPAASSERVGELIVPYCVRCLRHASAATTRSLAAGLSSCLVAFCLALALPLAWPSASLGSHCAVVLAGALLPLALRAWPRRPEPGHAAAERAVWRLPDGRLACASPSFATALSTQSVAEVEALPHAEPRFASWLLVGPLVAGVGAPLGWLFHHPLVRVLNLTEERLSIDVDGRPVLSLEPSSAESPTAGAEIRMPSGTHELGSTGPDGTRVTTAARLESGATHLFAPQSPHHCFWLEETRYGRAQGDPAGLIPLRGETRFWVLPRQVDTWFAPNPPPAAPDARSSGGLLVALRQAPCALAPPGARP